MPKENQNITLNDAKDLRDKVNDVRNAVLRFMHAEDPEVDTAVYLSSCVGTLNELCDVFDDLVAQLKGAK